MKRTLLVGLMVCGLAISSGCACGPWWSAPFGPGTLCDPGGGGSYGPAACGPVNPPVSGPSYDSAYAPVPAGVPGPACSGCGEVGGGSCGTACSLPRRRPYGPLTWLFDLLYDGYWGPSGGEVWWGDWHGAPPDCNDPCDRGGNFTGRGDASGGPGGCPSCGSGQSGRVYHVGAATTARPTVAATRSPAGDTANRSSQYAPRLISTTDRAVAPSLARSIPPTVLPRQRPANR